MQHFPVAYQWVLNMPNQPKMLAEATKLVGITEYPGKNNNNPVIMQMAADLGLTRDMYPNDERAWCALVHSWLCLKTGKPLPGKKYDLIRAKMFEQWADESVIPMYGDTLVFDRGTGDERHVCFYIGEDITTYHVLGGNQSNAYGFTRIARNRLKAARRSYSIAPPASVRQYIVSPTGLISRNEA